MQKILEIAKEITNPYSLLALTYLILFLLFSGVLAKTGPQRGKSGYRIIKHLSNLVAVVAVLTLFCVIGLKAYEVYQGSKAIPSRTNIIKDLTLSNLISRLRATDLKVSYHVEIFTGAHVLIGNNGQGVIMVSDLSVHWKYRKCPRFQEPLAGAPLVTYRYHIDLTASDGSKLLDTRQFKYGPGEVDEFLVDLNFLEDGIYTVWLSFLYKNLGEETWHNYETERDEIGVCERFSGGTESPINLEIKPAISQEHDFRAWKSLCSAPR